MTISKKKTALKAVFCYLYIWIDTQSQCDIEDCYCDYCVDKHRDCVNLNQLALSAYGADCRTCGNCVVDADHISDCGSYTLH